MNNDIPTIGELLEHPNLQGLVPPEEAEKIAESLGKDEDTSDPIYISILSGIGAWFSAGFLISFFVISGIINSDAGAIICGALLLVAACAIVRSNKGTFLRQLALALAFAGNILIAFGAATASSPPGELTSALLMHAAVCALMYPLYPSTTYRFLAPIGLAIMATLWIIEEEFFVFIHLLLAAEMLLAGFLLLWRKCPPVFMPLAYAGATMLPATLLFMNLTQMHLWRTDFNKPLWPSSLLLSGGLIFLLLRLAGSKRLAEPWMMLALVATVLLGIFTTPGILVAIALLIMGRAFSDRILAWLAYLFLPCFLIVFYYALHIDLVYKSYVVAGSGLLLLAVRWILQYLQTREVQR